MVQPESPEPKISVVPRVVKYGFGSIREYSILLTDRRMIFILASLSRAHLAAAALGGALGAAVASRPPGDSSSQSQAYAISEEPSTLAVLEGSLVVPYPGIQQITLKKYPADYELIVDFRDERGKKDRLRLQVGAPEDYLQRGRESGIDNKTVRRNYATEVQAALLKALPPPIASAARWDF